MEGSEEVSWVMKSGAAQNVRVQSADSEHLRSNPAQPLTCEILHWTLKEVFILWDKLWEVRQWSGALSFSQANSIKKLGRN